MTKPRVMPKSPLLGKKRFGRWVALVHRESGKLVVSILDHYMVDKKNPDGMYTGGTFLIEPLIEWNGDVPPIQFRGKLVLNKDVPGWTIHQPDLEQLGDWLDAYQYEFGNGKDGVLPLPSGIPRNYGYVTPSHLDVPMIPIGFREYEPFKGLPKSKRAHKVAKARSKAPAKPTLAPKAEKPTPKKYPELGKKVVAEKKPTEKKPTVKPTFTKVKTVPAAPKETKKKSSGTPRKSAIVKRPKLKGSTRKAYLDCPVDSDFWSS